MLAHLRFLAARLLTRTDKQAAERCGIPAASIYAWKTKDPDFRAEYQAVLEDGLCLTLEYSRRLLGETAQTLADALKAEKVVAVVAVGGEAGETRQITAPDW